MKHTYHFRLSRLATLCSITTLALLAITALPTTAQAQSPAVTGFTVGSIFSSFNADETIGWRFQALGDLDVSSLGYWDQTPGDNLASTHEVGLWTDAGALLGSITVQVNSGLVGSFRYEPLSSPISLTSGSFYRVGARDTDTDSDNYTSAVSGITTDVNIFFNQSIVSPNGSGFAFPSTLSGSQGRFGPNLLVSASAAPEPASLSLLALGGIVALRKRRKQA
jgi:hypothetical protein